MSAGSVLPKDRPATQSVRLMMANVDLVANGDPEYLAGLADALLNSVRLALYRHTGDEVVSLSTDDAFALMQMIDGARGIVMGLGLPPSAPEANANNDGED